MLSGVREGRGAAQEGDGAEDRGEDGEGEGGGAQGEAGALLGAQEAEAGHQDAADLLQANRDAKNIKNFSGSTNYGFEYSFDSLHLT